MHPKVVGEAGKVRFFELDDVSSRPKAATCRRTPKWLPTTAGRPQDGEEEEQAEEEAEAGGFIGGGMIQIAEEFKGLEMGAEGGLDKMLHGRVPSRRPREEGRRVVPPGPPGEQKGEPKDGEEARPVQLMQRG